MKLADLIIQLSANTASLEQDFKRARGQAGDFAASLKSALGSLGTAFSLGGLTAEIGHAIESANELGAALHKAQEITGLSATALSGLRAETRITGEDFGGLSTTLGRLQKNIEAGIIAPGSEAGKTLAALLGGSKQLKALGLEPLDQEVHTVLQAIFGLTNENERNFVASTLMGRGWQENIETLKAFADSGDKLKSVAEGVHGLYSQEEIDRLDRYSKSWNRLTTSLSNFAITVGGRLEEAIEAFSKGGMAGVMFGVEDWEGSYGILPRNGKSNKSLADLLGGHGKTKLAGNALLPYGPTEDMVGLDVLDRMKKAAQDFWLLFNQGVVTAKTELPAFVGNLSQLADAAALDEKAGYANSAAIDRWRDSLEKLSALPGGVPGGAVIPGGFLQDALLRGVPAMGKWLDITDAKAKALGEDLSSAFVKMIVGAGNFRAELKRLIDQFAEFLIKALVFKQLANAFSGTGGLGGLLGSFFSGLAGGRASGGPVSAGELYMVGESGPELFAPGASGSIIPNGAYGGGNSINIDARGGDAGTETKVMRAFDVFRRQMMGAALVQQYEYNARHS